MESFPYRRANRSTFGGILTKGDLFEFLKETLFKSICKNRFDKHCLFINKPDPGHIEFSVLHCNPAYFTNQLFLHAKMSNRLIDMTNYLIQTTQFFNLCLCELPVVNIFIRSYNPQRISLFVIANHLTFA